MKKITTIVALICSVIFVAEAAAQISPAGAVNRPGGQTTSAPPPQVQGHAVPRPHAAPPSQATAPARRQEMVVPPSAYIPPCPDRWNSDCQVWLNLTRDGNYYTLGSEPGRQIPLPGYEYYRQAGAYRSGYYGGGYDPLYPRAGYATVPDDYYYRRYNIGGYNDNYLDPALAIERGRRNYALETTTAGFKVHGPSGFLDKVRVFVNGHEKGVASKVNNRNDSVIPIVPNQPTIVTFVTTIDRQLVCHETSVTAETIASHLAASGGRERVMAIAVNEDTFRVYNPVFRKKIPTGLWNERIASCEPFIK